MKNLSLILNGVLLIAVAILFYMQFSSKSQAGSGGANVLAGSGGGGRVVYINTDTLMSNYKFYEDLQNELGVKKNLAERQLISRGQKLEEEIRSYQTRMQANLLSNNEIKVAEQGLNQKQQELMQQKDAIGAGLMEEERLMTMRLYDTLHSFLRKYNQEKKYSYIMGYTKLGSILLADPNGDITQEVLKTINEKYAVDKKEQPADKK